MDEETEEKRCADEPMGDAMENVDVDMEDDGALAGAGLSLTDELSQLVFNELAASLPQVKCGGMKRLVIDEAAAEGKKNIDLQLGVLNYQIGSVYKLKFMEEFELAVLAANHAASRAREVLAPPTTEPDSEARKQLQAAFEQPYVGNTHLKFHGYLARCWHAYKAKRNGYTSPYVPLVQSSGFGKSRLLRELAEVTKNDTAMPRTQLTDSDSEISMRVLYVCARRVPKSSGFPVATPSLTRWFFSEDHTVEVMKERLLTTFKYAQQYWERVGNEWFKLFSNPSADESVGAAIAAPLPDRLSEDDRSLNRLLVLVVDEARTLFDLKDAHGVDFFRLLRRALKAANEKLGNSSYGGGIFAVLVDTNSKVHDFAPPQENDPSSRKTKHRGATALFPPFVLTHTMDVFCRTPQSLTPDPDTGSASAGSLAGTPPDVPNSESPPAGPFDYKASVTLGDPEVKWAALISMGRPLWKSFVGKDASLDMQKGLISKLAASKLLLGQPPDLEASYNESTMFGVAALLCRLGLRPHSSSALSSRIVADFMGVLNYVTFTNDSHITSYPSEPVLAFGAASLWYQLQSAALEKYLLPRFQEMLMQRLVDIGDIGEVVARIFLLLAMDATVMLSPMGPKVLKANFIFSGQFCTVRQFLDELGTPHVLKNSNGVKATPEQKADHETWMNVWNDWKVGFSQFEDLPEEPTEEMLWLLLGRRAAGVLRRNQRGADLVIPIFSGNDVSFILVQVKNRVKDKEYPASATTNLLPGIVFKGTNSLEKKLPRDMIRLYITLREEATVDEPARMYVMTTRRARRTKCTSARVGARQRDYQEKPTYALCLRSVCKPLPEAEAMVDADADAVAASRPWSFLSSGLSRCLEQIANAAWWDMKERVLSDVKRRDDSDFGELLNVLSKNELMEALECSQPIVLRDGRHAP